MWWLHKYTSRVKWVWKFSCFFFRFGIIWEEKCFWFEIHQLIYNTLQLFMLIFKYLIRSSKHGLYCVVKVIFLHKWWRRCGNSGYFSRWGNFLTGDGLCVCGLGHSEEYSFYWLVNIYIYLFGGHSLIVSWCNL